jgi:hypothetical protein
MRKISIASLLLFIITSASFYLFLALTYSDQPDRIGYACGYLVGIALWWIAVAFIMWRWVFKKKKGTFFLSFSTLFFLTCIYQVFQVRNSLAYQAKAVGERPFVISELSQRLDNPEMKFSSENGYSEADFGDYATVFSVARRTATVYGEEELKLHQAFEDLDINSILVPATLGDKKRLIEARVRLKDFLQRVAVIQSTAETFAEKEFEAVDKAPFRDLLLKKKFMINYAEGMEALDAVRGKMYDLDREIVGKIDELLLFLQDMQANYQLDGNKLSFKNPEDQQKVESKIAEIGDLATKEEAYSKKVDASQKEILTSLLSCF